MDDVTPHSKLRNTFTIRRTTVITRVHCKQFQAIQCTFQSKKRVYLNYLSRVTMKYCIHVYLYLCLPLLPKLPLSIPCLNPLPLHIFSTYIQSFPLPYSISSPPLPSHLFLSPFPLPHSIQAPFLHNLPYLLSQPLPIPRRLHLPLSLVTLPRNSSHLLTYKSKHHNTSGDQRYHTKVCDYPLSYYITTRTV